MVPTQEDFDNAVKQKWSTNTCILAQCAKRLGIPLLSEDKKRFLEPFNTDSAQDIMDRFDKYFYAPGDEYKANLQLLRRELGSGVLT